MDRTVITPWRVEEKEQSEKLFRKLYALTVLYPPSDEFRKCLTEDMFLKANQHAFFHVMHYVFRLLDPVEFKKRFYWPITDKRAEAHFRSSTIEYLKFLNDKHHLQWTSIKSYLVVMPGGMKFINFMLDFVGFVIQELIRQREKQLNVDVITGLNDVQNLECIKRQNIFFKEYASAYIREVNEQTEKLQEKTQALRNQLDGIAVKTNIPMSILISEECHTEFEKHNHKLFNEKYIAPVDDIISLECPIRALKEEIESFHIREAENKYDKDIVRRSLLTFAEIISMQHGDNEKEYLELIPTTNDDIKMESLMLLFNNVVEVMENCLTIVTEKPSTFEFVNTELETLQTDLHQIESQINDFQKIINTKLSSINNCVHTPIGKDATNINDDSLMMKFVYTPPIKMETLNSNRNVNTRLPLLHDNSVKVEKPVNNLVAHSVRKLRTLDYSMDLNNTVGNKSKIIDPIQLLRTISKNTPSTTHRFDGSLSSLGLRWKQRQNDLLRNDYETQSKEIMVTDRPTEVATTTLLPQSSLTLTPFNSNNCTRISRSKLLDPMLYTKTFSAFKKVQDSSLNFQNLSTSPSGRLEPLVSIEEGDVRIADNNFSFEGKQVETCNQNKLENFEHNLNVASVTSKLALNFNISNDEQLLCDISDSVIKDVI